MEGLQIVQEFDRKAIVLSSRITDFFRALATNTPYLYVRMPSILDS